MAWLLEIFIPLFEVMNQKCLYISQQFVVIPIERKFMFTFGETHLKTKSLCKNTACKWANIKASCEDYYTVFMQD